MRTTHDIALVGCGNVAKFHFPGMAEAVFRGLDNLLTWVDGGPESPNSGEDKLRSVALLDAAYRSADSGEPVILTAGLPR